MRIRRPPNARLLKPADSLADVSFLSHEEGGRKIVPKDTYFCTATINGDGRHWSLRVRLQTPRRARVRFMAPLAPKLSPGDKLVMYEGSRKVGGVEIIESVPRGKSMNDIGHEVMEWQDRTFGDPTLMEQFLVLSEEVGEVARCIVKKHQGIRPDDRGNLSDELADVILCVTSMAARAGIDLDVAVADKQKRVFAKVYTRDKAGE